MNTILLVEDIQTVPTSLLDICSQWEEKHTILNTYDIDDAISRIPPEEVDLVICDLTTAGVETIKNYARLTYTHPYVPSIAITSEQCSFTDNILKIGFNCCLQRPVDEGELLRWITELLEVSNSGSIKGLPIHSLLQMLEGEEKTCSLQVSSKGKVGYIYLKRGVVFTSEFNSLRSEDAFYHIVAWDETDVNIKYFNGQRRQDINKPLISLLMEAFRLKDERANLEEKRQSKKKPAPELKRISTAGNKFFLEAGSKIKMELSSGDPVLMGKVVGMIPDKFVIISSPVSQAIIEKVIADQQRLKVKYLHMGRICLFQSLPLHAITEPTELVFIDYPSIIHYQELRRVKRASTFIPCTFLDPESTSYMGVVADLSKMGCLCKVKTLVRKTFPDIDINTKVQLRCLIPGLQEDEILHGLVKNIKKSKTEARIGLEFVDLQAHVKKAIEKYLDSVEMLFS